MTMRVRTVQDPDGSIGGFEIAPAPLSASECVWCHSPLVEGAGIIDADHLYCDDSCAVAHIEWSAAMLRRAGWIMAVQSKETP